MLLRLTQSELTPVSPYSLRLYLECIKRMHVQETSIHHSDICQNKR